MALKSWTRTAAGFAAILAVGAFGVGALSVTAFAHAPHVHGLARLTVTVHEDILVIALESPLDNLVGFEHAPRTAAQRAALEGLVHTLENPSALFSPPAAAGCTASVVTLESPVLTAMAKADRAHADEDENERERDEHVHADLLAEFTFHCARPQHLDSINVNLFVPFPRLERINAEVATAEVQTAARLDVRNTLLRWR